MAMNYAIIENGIVTNVAVAAAPLADNWIPAGSASIGWSWDGEAFAPPPGPPFPEAQTQALQDLASRRYQAESAGTTFAGFPLATDPVSQAKITAAYVKASADADYTIPSWKFGPGIFAPLDAATIIAAANAMEAHVQACFANEAALSGQIMAATDGAELAAVDLEAGWP
jgi:hypothetical protein